MATSSSAFSIDYAELARLVNENPRREQPADALSDAESASDSYGLSPPPFLPPSSSSFYNSSSSPSSPPPPPRSRDNIRHRHRLGSNGAPMRHARMVNSTVTDLSGAAPRQQQSSAALREQRADDRVYPAEAAEADAPGAETETWRSSPEYDRFLRELGHGSGPDKCFGCMRITDMSHVAPVCADGIRKIGEMVRTQTNVDRMSLAREIAALFEESVRQKANRCKKPGEEECPAWSAADIYEHFFTQEHKRLDAFASIQQRILYYEEALSRMNRHYVYTEIQDERGAMQRVPDARRLKESISLSMYLDKMYSLKPGNMALASAEGPVLQRADTIAKRPTYSILPYIGINGKAAAGGGGGSH